MRTDSFASIQTLYRNTHTVVHTYIKHSNMVADVLLDMVALQPIYSNAIISELCSHRRDC